MRTISVTSLSTLKDALCTAPMLLFPDPTLPYTVVTNAFGIVARGLLMQDQGVGL